MESSSQDKSLPATERKLQKAREEGQVARSKDLSHIAVLGSGCLALVVLLPLMLQEFRTAMVRQFSFNAQSIASPSDAIERMQSLALLGLGATVPFGLAVSICSLVATVAAGGWIFTLKPVMPDFSRLSPLAGFGKLFSKDQLTETLKLLVITAILSTVATAFISGSMHQLASLVLQPSSSSIGFLASWITGGMSLLLLTVGMVALIDVPLQNFLHRSKLKMSHEEVKQEHKESDGNPQMKGKMRARQREISHRNSVSAVPKADFVVMNPTHYAVALKYDEASMSAPQVIAKGADMLAMKIREIATHNSVPVLQSPMLARALYAHAELNREIPSALYSAVAQVLAYVYRLRAAMKGEAPMPGDLPQPFVPPELDPLSKTVAVTETP